MKSFGAGRPGSGMPARSAAAFIGAREKCSGFFIDVFGLDKINYSSGLLSNKFMSKLMGNPEKMNEFIWTMLSQVMILILNYVFSKLVVFKKPKNAVVQEKQ